MSCLFSKGNFYLGVDEEKFCDFDIHLGRFVLQYTCPAGQNPPQDDGTNNRSSQESDN